MAFEVVVGMPELMAAFTPSLPMLLIDADSERIERFRINLEGEENRRMLHCRQAVVGVPEDGEIEWNHFNDGRLDGPWTEVFWRRHFPNARAIGHSLVLPQSLADLLDQWPATRPEPTQARGMLTIRQGDPIAVMRSSGNLLDRFELIHIQLPVTDPEVLSKLDSFLAANGFLRREDSSWLWQRDALLAAEHALVQIRQHCSELEDQLAASSVRLLVAEETETKLKQKQVEVEDANLILAAERDALRAERQQQDDTLAQLSQSIQDLNIREQIRVAERDEAAARRDVLAQENDRLRAENQDLTAQVQQLMGVHQQLMGEHHHLADRFAALEALHHSLALERDELAHHYHMLEAERSRLEALQLETHQQMEHLTDSLAQRERQISALTTANDLLIEERDAMFSQLSEQDVHNQDDEQTSQCSSTSIRELFLSGRYRSSDKWETYLDTYDSLLKPYRGRQVRLLEIGVQNGGSLECWADFLGPNAVVIGIDIDPNCGLIEFASPQVRCYVGDATSTTWMEELCRKHGPFDIVIDDGSHLSEEIVSTFRTLYPRLARGGLYVVEDLHCCYFSSHGGGIPGSTPTAMAFFQALTDVLNHEHWSERSMIPLNEVLPVLGPVEDDGLSLESLLQLESIEFHNSMVAVRRRPLGINTLGVRVVGTGEASVSKEPSESRGSRLSKP